MTQPTKSAIFNVPNQATLARIVLSAVLFYFLAQGEYLIGLVLFAIAAGTDWFDGYYARRYGQVTQLGRILDPFADKIIICGSFVFLVAIPQSRIAAWMAVVVIGRELLVTALRSFLEERGGDFSAGTSGKLKMVLQCAVVIASLLRLLPWDAELGQWTVPPSNWLTTTVDWLAWSAVGLTVYSGVEYILAAARIFRRMEEDAS